MIYYMGRRVPASNQMASKKCIRWQQFYAVHVMVHLTSK